MNKPNPPPDFHPSVRAWLYERFSAPTPVQQEAWAAYRSGEDVLVAAPTGSGKTLAAFLAAIDDLAREGDRFGLPDETRVLYISPLKALSNDIHRNLEDPLAGINGRLFESGAMPTAIRAEVRTGDTSASVRAAINRRPPHILVTTPESTYLLLTSPAGRRTLQTVRTVIVDEIHAIVANKRGAHLALSLERLERLVGQRLTRIGLSATQHPIAEVARFLTGGRACRIIDGGHRRELDLAIEVPAQPLEAVLSAEAARDIHDRMAELIEAHRTTLVFVNTRRQAERLARALSERLGSEQIGSHHGSLSRDQRLTAERRLKAGQFRALVATASLELGIDVGDVDLVCQLGSTGLISTFLQRVGRSGHCAGGLPRGRLFPTSRDDLLESIALLDAARRGELDRLYIPTGALDVLAQQIVAMVSAEELLEDEVYALVRRAYPYRALPRADFDAVLKMLTEGYSSSRGQRGAYLYRDGIHRRLRARKGARLTALTCGGAIPDNADYRVILEPAGDFIGTVDEDFAIESMAGDIFQLGNASWRVLRLEAGILRVEDAQHQPPSIPFWFGEAPGRSFELSVAVSRLRREVEQRLEAGTPGETPVTAAPTADDPRIRSAIRYLAETVGVTGSAARQAVEYLAAAKWSLGVLPTLETLVFERFFDDSGGMQFIIHSPYGSRVNRAWGLALRKRFCRSFNFELQAAATENAIILSLGTSQSFALEEVSRYLHPGTVRNLLVQAVLAAPMFTIRWRWNAVCSLAIKRFQGGRKTPPYLLRMQAEDLVSSIFPEQLACLENIVGDRPIPDHPLVRQTLDDCLHEAMDIERLEALLAAIEDGRVRVICRDVVEPSPLAAEIVNARVYSFLDGAPLEERRTRAVSSRRWLSPSQAEDIGRLDPGAIERVRAEAWPVANDADELHDALQTVGFIDAREAEPAWAGLFQALTRQDRAATLCLPEGRRLWVAAERLPQFRAFLTGIDPADTVSPGGATAQLSDPALWARLPSEYRAQVWDPDSALREILRARLGASGPVTAVALTTALGLPPDRIRAALAALQTEGYVLRGRFTPAPEPGPEHPRIISASAADPSEEWCERRLLARIHRYTLQRLRQEIEPVSSADFMRFLLHWQQVHPNQIRRGREALAAVLNQLEGFEAAASAWEAEILPARIADYDPAWLDSLCLAGKVTWGRLSPGQSSQGPVRSSPIAFTGRRNIGYWRALADPAPGSELSPTARHVAETLAARGASFFDELAEAARLLRTQLEPALAELVGLGYVASDSFMGLRTLLIPEQKKQRYQRLALSIEEAGRWSLIRPLDPADTGGTADEEARRAALAHVAGILLQRYGVIFRALLRRETLLPPWQDLLQVFRRLEARGEIRGGRFVAGQFGEQFALPEAVESLRAIRRSGSDGTLAVLSAADPLNLTGILLGGPRVPSLSNRRILFRDGIPLAVSEGQQVRFFESAPKESEWTLRQRLLRRTIPNGLRAYLG